MQALKTQINPRSAEFRANADAMRTLVARPAREGRRSGAWAAATAARDRHTARGKLLPRDRVAQLLDPGTPFLEIGQLAAHGMYDGDAPCGRRDRRHRPHPGRRLHGGRQRRHREGRHLLPDDGEEAPARAGDRASRTTCRASTWSIPAARSCRSRTRCFPTATTSAASSTTRPTCRAKGIPQVAVVMGSCTAGGAYVPAMSDETVIVRNQGTIFLGGPPLVKAATGEVVSAEDLGGGDVHTRISGVADHLAENDAHALYIARRIVANFNRAQAAHGDAGSQRGAAVRPRGDLRHHPAGHAQALRRARDHRARRRRLALRRVQGALRHDAGDRLRAPARHAGRHRRQQRHPVRRVGAEGRALHRAVRAARRAAGVPAEHHRLHGRAQVRERRHRQGRREDGDRGGDRAGAQVHRC